MPETGQIDYQRAGQVRQLLAERANAVAYGQTDRIAAADKQLAELGFATDRGAKQAGTAGEAPEKAPPQGRATRQRQTADAEAPQTVRTVRTAEKK